MNVVRPRARPALTLGGLLAATLCTTPAVAARPGMVVTTTPMQSPLVTLTDPKTPRQPVPAHDGADYLKTLPGFSVIRKGGTDGDPLFRGMAASRVNILQNGELVLGGCGSRMDPPTAYVFPESFDRIVVLKGPQTVLHGPGNSAATVLFERDPIRRDERAYGADGSALVGSSGRVDLLGELMLASPTGYARFIGTATSADDYEDGGGNDVNSEYERTSGNMVLGWNPDPATNVEISGGFSDGEAAYADRMMDGVAFERENLGLGFSRQNISPLVTAVQGRLYYNYIDHVMDNYSLRLFTPSMMMPDPAVSNPDRRTLGARLSADLRLGEGLFAVVGLDFQENEHSVRGSMNQPAMPYQDLARIDDATFRDTGLFGELTFDLAHDQRIVSGLRFDDWSARDKRETVQPGTMMPVPNPTAGQHRTETLASGFVRYERDLAAPALTFYAGFGRVERFPDYWELFSNKESAASISAFGAAPEQTSQLDIGLVARGERLAYSLSGFWSEMDDYLLIQGRVPKGMRFATITRNVDAATWGAEADASWLVAGGWTVTGALAYTHGENEADGGPLAQMPPLEGRIGLGYAGTRWTAGALWRLVNGQHRIAIDQGNVVGQDIGESSGFGTLSLNAGWQAGNHWQATAGVDNLLDRSYAEHISRAGAMVSGYVQTTRVNEPGRTLWVRLGASFR